MNLHTMKLVTIICEALIEERVVEILRHCGTHGHTAFSVRGSGSGSGSGSQGDRSADIVETGNVQVEVIVKPAVAEAVLERLHRELFKDYAMVAYETEVRVMRPEKF